MKKLNIPHTKSYIILFFCICTVISALPPSDTQLHLPVTPETDDTIQILRGDISAGSFTPITITRSGTYRLNGPLSATGSNIALTIDANNVTLDLDGNTISGGATGIIITGTNVTIKNGTVQNTSATGITVSGSNCHINAVDVVHSSTGFLVQNSTQNVLANCRALQSTSAGFSLVSSFTNSITNCRAINTNGYAHSAYGFISSSGYGNIFDSCTAQNTQTAATDPACCAAGFLCSADTASCIKNSSVSHTCSLASTTTAYGIWYADTQQCVCTNNTVFGTTTPNSLGIGIRAESSQNYIAANTAYDNDTNYHSAASQYITSQANTRGVYNTDSNNTVGDSVEIIHTNLALVNTENWSIESKCETISANLDTLIPALSKQTWSIESKCDIINSRIDLLDPTIDTGFYTIESGIDVIVSKVDALTPPITAALEPVNSKLDVLAYCPFTPIRTSGTTATNKQFITGPITLDTTGTYCLSGNCSGGITVSGDYVNLDLNNYTITGGTNGLTVNGSYAHISNGTIKNATQNGVSISDSGCMLENIDVVGTPTGFYITGGSNNLLTNCRALECTQNGFLLSSGTRNTMSGCAVNTLGDSANPVSGFYSSNGSYNTFDGCSITNINTTAASATAQGFRFANENYSTVSNCTIDGIRTTQDTTNLYGVYVPFTQNQQATYNAATNGKSISWLKSGSNNYLALGCKVNGSGNEILILKYTGSTTLSSITGANWGYDILTADWIKSGIYNYLACGSTSATGNIRIYRFTEPATLSTTPTAVSQGNDVNDFKWYGLDANGTSYLLALAGKLDVTTNPVRVGLFTSNNSDNPPGTWTTLANYTTAPLIAAYGCDWFNCGGQLYVAAGFEYSASGAELRVIKFTRTSATAGTLVNAITTTIGKTVYAVRTLTTNSGKYYVAACTVDAPHVRIFEFDPVTPALTLKAQYTHTSATSKTIYSCSWLSGVDNLNYLAIGGEQSNDGYTARVLRFDGSCLTPIYNYSGTNSIYGLDWLTTGSTMLAAAIDSTTGTARTFGFELTGNAITNNTITNVNGGASATAFAVEANNYLLENIATNNTTNYYYTPQSGDSNRGY